MTIKLSLPKTFLAIACLSGCAADSTFAQFVLPVAARATQQEAAPVSTGEAWKPIQTVSAVRALISSRAPVQQLDGSPSDISSPVVQETLPVEPEPSPLDLGQPPLQSDNSLAPLQRRELSSDVRAINTSSDDIGTSILPTPAALASWGDQVPLPDGVARGATFQCVHWRPSLICHHPLYFQDVMLERHGHDRFGYLQPFASGAKFFGTIFMAPYLKTLQHPGECQYALGYHRAGTCAPVLKSHIPWDKRAAAVETLSLAGFFWAAPL